MVHFKSSLFDIRTVYPFNRKQVLDDTQRITLTLSDSSYDFLFNFICDIFLVSLCCLHSNVKYYLTFKFKIV